MAAAAAKLTNTLDSDVSLNSQKVVRDDTARGHNNVAVVSIVFPDAETYAAANKLRRRHLYRAIKRIFDITCSAAVFALFWWLFVLIALAIKLDTPGSVIFKQERLTKDGKRFTMYKFRTMYQDAEHHLEHLLKLNEKDGPVFKIADDPRITRVGRILRKTSMDELPQFVNVLLGSMSVVGPRPALVREASEYHWRARQRLLVKAGITCYWQTRRNRDAISFDDWVELDLTYIKKCSLWTDFKIIIQTVGIVLTAQGE